MLVKAKGMDVTLPPKAEIPLMVAGRLARFINAWKVLTKDSWVLEAIKAFKIPFVGQSTVHCIMKLQLLVT